MAEKSETALLAEIVLADPNNGPGYRKLAKAYLELEARPLSKSHVLMITTAYEQGVGKGHQHFNGKTGIVNPYGDALCKEAWQLGFDEGIEQAKRKAEKPT